MRVKKCCCCIPIKIGAYIIGSFHVLGLLIGMYFFDMISICLEVFCATAFLFMIYKDSQQKRLIYFSTYMVLQCILAVIRMVFTFWQKDEAYGIRLYCAEVGAHFGGAWDKTDFKDEEDCRGRTARSAMI